MSAVTREAVEACLRQFTDPHLDQDPVSAGCLREVDIQGARVAVRLELGYAAGLFKNGWAQMLQMALENLDGVDSAQVKVDCVIDSHQGQAQVPALAGVKNVIAVASGKGGVGKSSMTVNLATALAAQGLTVGIVDADIYGHSVPGLMGSDDKGPTVVDEMIMPPIAHGVRHISVGQFVEGNAPIVWRGPMLTRAIQQFLADVYWGDLDVLFMDLPPGTGDVAITVAQLVPNAELLIVTTPQAAAAEVAERAGTIAQQTDQKIAGVIENMSGMTMPDGTVMNIFGEGGGEQVAERLTQLTDSDVALLGSIPLDPSLREHGDTGTPVVISEPDSPAAKAIRAVADQLKVRRESLAGKSLNPRVK